MSTYDEKIYNDALKVAKTELSEAEAEEVAKAFATAYAEVKNLSKPPSQDEMLQLYGLSKQGLQNPPFDQKPQPSFYQMKERAMWNAWKKVVDDGVKPVDAQKEYTKLVNTLIEKYGKA